MTSVNLRTVFAFAREMHRKNPEFGNIEYGECETFLLRWHIFTKSISRNSLQGRLGSEHCE